MEYRLKVSVFICTSVFILTAVLAAEPVKSTTIYGEVGGPSFLPCVQSAKAGDIKTVTWMHGSTAFYSISGGQKIFHVNYANRMDHWGDTGIQVLKTRLQDEGNYTCRITDNSDATTGTNVQLIVTDSTQGSLVVRITQYKQSINEANFVTYTSDTNLPPGSVVVLSAWTTSYKPPAKLIWKRNDVKIEGTTEADVTKLGDDGFGNSDAKLEYTITEEDESVTLACSALGPDQQEWKTEQVALAAYHEQNEHEHGENDKPSDGSSMPIIIGATVAVVLLIIIIILLVILICRMRKRQKHPITTSRSRPTSEVEGQEGEEMKPLRTPDRDDGPQVKVTRHPSYRKSKPDVKVRKQKPENNNAAAAAENTQA
eukprot:GHVU01187201.1.p1 GENE.GHVU01187201.1~~GHVU01187201.1.p1  ORF type:complete len:370 (-),score=41.65 GHVU01187201.1:2988-4097(-)